MNQESLLLMVCRPTSAMPPRLRTGKTNIRMHVKSMWLTSVSLSNVDDHEVEVTSEAGAELIVHPYIVVLAGYRPHSNFKGKKSP